MSIAIWYRGQRYELGRGPGFFGIWAAGGSPSQPLEQWPETPDGWSAAWVRFTTIETPGSIVHLSQDAGVGNWAGVATGASDVAKASGPVGADWVSGAVGAAWASGPAAAPEAGPAGQAGPVSAGGPVSSGGGDAAYSDRAIGGGIMVAAGVGAGIVALFPNYFAGTSLARESFELIPHLIYLAAWAVSAALILAGGARRQAGALLGAGTGLVTFGLFFADLGTALTSTPRSVGPALPLALFGWLSCTAGSALAFRRGPGGAPAWPWRQPRGSTLVPAVASAVALGAAIAFAPSWDSYTLRTATGPAHTVTAGYAFANPGLVIAGDVAVMVAIVAVAIAASLWRPGRLGAVLLAGAAIPLVAQAISAFQLVAQPVSPTIFGISPAQATQLGLVISTGLTPAFWLYCAFVVLLAATAGWILLPARKPAPSQSGYPAPLSAHPFSTSPSPQFAGIEDGPTWTSMSSPGPGATAPPGGFSAPTTPPSS